MPGTIAQSVGVDIAKDTLDVHLHPASRVRRFPNDAKGWAALIAWLNGFVIGRVAFEPTGAYHRGFERRLAEAGLPLVKVNPRQAPPKRSAGMPRQMPSTRRCSPASRPSSSRRCGLSSVLPSMR